MLHWLRPLNCWICSREAGHLQYAGQNVAWYLLLQIHSLNLWGAWPGPCDMAKLLQPYCFICFDMFRYDSSHLSSCNWPKGCVLDCIALQHITAYRSISQHVAPHQASVPLDASVPLGQTDTDAEYLLGRARCASFLPLALFLELLESWLPCYCSCSLLNCRRQKRIPSVITFCYQRHCHGSPSQAGTSWLVEHCSVLSTTDTNTLCSYPFRSAAPGAVKSEQVHNWFAPGGSVWLPMLLKFVQSLQDCTW